MNPAATPQRRSAMLSYFSLFTSLSTLLCCALPSLLVLFGLGASVAPILASPWLVTLSRHKVWTFSISGILIGLSFVNMYYFVPRLKGSDVCDIDDGSACRDASRVSKILLWVSAGIFSVGFFVAYALGPILTKLDR
jgi:hypothetical protein